MNQTAQMNGYGFELDGASASVRSCSRRPPACPRRRPGLRLRHGDWSWLVGVSTGLRHACRPSWPEARPPPCSTPLAGDARSAAESAVAAGSGTAPASSRVTAGRVCRCPRIIPADAKVTVTSLGGAAPATRGPATTLAGVCELPPPAGRFGMNQTAQMNGATARLDGACRPPDPLAVLVKTTGLSLRIAAEKHQLMSIEYNGCLGCRNQYGVLPLCQKMH